MHDAPRNGEMRQFVYRTIARGADGVLGFRWRSCPFGAEQYWQGVLDHHGEPGGRYAEFQQIGEELRNLGPTLLGSWTHVEAAVAGADQAVNDAFAASSLGLPWPDAIAGEVHRLLYDAGYATGVVHPADDLRDLKLLVIPHWAMFDPAWVPRLSAWVEAGGTLLIGALTATRDLNNQVIRQPAPGVLTELTGVEVKHFERINDPHWRPATLRFTDLQEAATMHWREALCFPKSGSNPEVIARWNDTEPTSQLADSPAVTRHRVGAGSVVYAGTYLSGGFARTILSRCAEWADLTPIVPGLPESVEAVIRTNHHQQWLFLFNCDGAQSKKIELDGAWQTRMAPPATKPDHQQQRFQLPPLGVAVLYK
jgi:beta-galactosidase